MRANYPSDITREQYEMIRHILESTRKVTRPCTIDTYDIFCAVLYRKREGCRWRSLPHDFPKWQVCYWHYDKWRKSINGEESALDLALRELVENERRIHGRDGETSMLILDSRSVKNTDTAELKGYDAAKKHQG